VTDAAKKLQLILGSAAFEALEAYLRDREHTAAFIANPDANDPHEPRVISRTMTDGIRTKDGAA
jgi:hypothetical protein